MKGWCAKDMPRKWRNLGSVNRVGHGLAFRMDSVSRSCHKMLSYCGARHPDHKWHSSVSGNNRGKT